MFDLITSVLEALAGNASQSTSAAPPASDDGSRRLAQAMLQRAATLEASPNPIVRLDGQELRARANALLAASGAPQSRPVAPAPVSAPAAPARSMPARPAVRPAVGPPTATRPVAAAAQPVAAAAQLAAPPAVVPVAVAGAPREDVRGALLADLHNPRSLLRSIVTAEALGAPLALRDTLGAPFTHR
ncbi:MAG TPA: hypothetical protein VGD50_01395 [Candidatus Baltobacteraceae bacterium]